MIALNRFPIVKTCDTKTADMVFRTLYNWFMNFEDQIFLKSLADYERLVKFGFTQEGDWLLYSYIDEPTSLEVQIRVSANGKVRCTVYDPSINDVYDGYRIDGVQGPFASGFRTRIEAFLQKLKEECFTTNLFQGTVANSLVEAYEDVFGAQPDLPWTRDYTDYVVFRTKENGKWFALIMAVPYDRLIKGKTGNCEIVNLKLDDEVEAALKEPGVLPAYHMNKKRWVSVLLDGTVDLKRVLELSSISYRNVVGAKKK